MVILLIVLMIFFGSCFALYSRHLWGATYAYGGGLGLIALWLLLLFMVGGFRL